MKNDVVGKFDGPGVTGSDHYIKFTKHVKTEYLSVQIVEGSDNALQVQGMKVINAGRTKTFCPFYYIVKRPNCCWITLQNIASWYNQEKPGRLLLVPPKETTTLQTLTSNI